MATAYNYGSSFISIVIMISSLLDSSSTAFCSTFVKLSLGLLVFKIFASIISISYCTKSIKLSTEWCFCEGVHGFCFSGRNIVLYIYMVWALCVIVVGFLVSRVIWPWLSLLRGRGNVFADFVVFWCVVHKIISHYLNE